MQENRLFKSLDNITTAETTEEENDNDNPDQPPTATAKDSIKGSISHLSHLTLYIIKAFVTLEYLGSTTKKCFPISALVFLI